MAAPRPSSGRTPLRANFDSRNVGEQPFVDLAEADDRAGLVERPARRQHPLHQRRLGAGEHVADGALLLHRRAQRMLDVAAVEGGDGLELVEGDRHPLAPRLGDARRAARRRRPPGARCRAPCVPPGRSARRAARRRPAASKRTSGRNRLQQLRRPAAQPARRCVRGEQQRARVGLEKGDVRARGGDGHLHGQDAARRPAPSSRRG